MNREPEYTYESELQPYVDELDSDVFDAYKDIAEAKDSFIASCIVLKDSGVGSLTQPKEHVKESVAAYQAILQVDTEMDTYEQLCIVCQVYSATYTSLLDEAINILPHLSNERIKQRPIPLRRVIADRERILESEGIEGSFGDAKKWFATRLDDLTVCIENHAAEHHNSHSRYSLDAISDKNLVKKWRQIKLGNKAIDISKALLRTLTGTTIQKGFTKYKGR